MTEQTGKTGILSSLSTENSKKFSLPERRGQTRFAFTADAEAVELRSKTRVSGRCSDLSLSGCYIDSLTPFNSGADVHIQLTRNGRAFEAFAVVTYSHHALGMGLRFTDVAPGQRVVLSEWLAELGGARVPEQPATVAESSSTGEDTNWLIVLNQLIALLVRKKILSRDEGNEFLRKIFH